MTDQRKAVKEAADIYRYASTYDDTQREEAILRLGKRGIWSLAQIAKIAQAPKRMVYNLVQKEDRTGGRLNPDTLELILEEIALKDQNESNPFLTAKIIEMGTSSYMLAMLIGVNPSTVKWRVDKAKGAAA